MRGILRVDIGGTDLPLYLRPIVAQAFFNIGGNIVDKTRPVNDEENVTGLLDKGPELGLTLLQGPLGPLLLAYVPADADDGFFPANFGARGTYFHGENAAIFAPVPGLKIAVDLAEIPKFPADPLFGHIGIPIPDLKMEELLSGIAKHLGKTFVGLDNPVFLVNDHYTQADLADEGAEPDCLLSQLLLYLVAFGNAGKDGIAAGKGSGRKKGAVFYRSIDGAAFLRTCFYINFSPFTL